MLKKENQINSPFWRTVIHTHLDTKSIIKMEEVNETNFHMQTLWNNVSVKYKDKTLFFQDWEQAGIERVNDIIKEDESRLLTIDEVNRIIQKHPANILFQYNALMNALPVQWKQWAQQFNSTNQFWEEMLEAFLNQF